MSRRWVRVGGGARWDLGACKHIRRIVVISKTKPRASCVEAEAVGIAQLEEVTSTGPFFMPNDATSVATICKLFVFETDLGVTSIRSREEKT